ncbi:MAG TPA: multifunctional oxoglutarate decarboxylase/oxoglutarate dehydrogenase thiamine pyrophosphate-binding subunit/dihydrolipoyllysine-residue succinyltransferase subunit [Pyrinomonadaceae bacterium]|nr:multifunctional oxoglutarate decarboxylase/oxoglutarate dehydrogenase thiamine pyrophosphate-binding subunit/dihydrolipoyllysine-residue succinyltransferase subunit [Pyrinomonadaceae bacterium]
MSKNQNTTDLSQVIAENFGANATYVEGLLSRFRSDPSLVDESWRAYFAELLRGEPATPTTTTTSSTTTAPATRAPEGTDNGRAAAAGAAAAATTTGGDAAGGTTTAAAAAPATSAAPAAASAPTAPAPQQRETAPAAAAATPTETAIDATPIHGGALKIVENMEASLGVPTATSQRRVPVKLLDENRRIINRYLQEQARSKTSYTHLVAWAIIRALSDFPQLNDGFETVDGQPMRLRRESVNFGVAIDLAKKDGSRTLLVPNIKGANRMRFAEFLAAYDDVVRRARGGKLQIPDFQGTTISLTNPGTLGTVASMPRLMAGQGVIIATGAIEYPAEYQAMAPEVLSQLGISKAMTISSTYDHRVIQGAESGAFLARVHELLVGQHGFYDEIFRDLEIADPPMRWSIDRNPALLGGDHIHDQIIKQARVLELINAYRVRGHLIADIDPLHAMPLHYHPELDIETYGLTIWDLDREFITGGLAGKKSTTLRDILEILHRAYCGKVGIEYRHIQSKDQKLWIRERIRQQFVEPQPIPPEIKKQLLWKLISAEQFERFLHTKYLGQKRFSIEGMETIIPLLDQLIEGAAARGVEDITLGMAHRGRLNVLVNIVGEFMAERIFASFEGSVHPNFPADEGDVKYHQGATSERETASGRKIKLTLSPNPSHLEFVDPVVEGMVRAKQDWMTTPREESIDRALPVLLHGDAAFAGQGIVMETLNLAELHGYRTGGTIHIIINNQIGFTTSPEKGRSTIYSTDVARMTQLPIFHINGDDPEAAYRVLQLALDYRQEFNKDVVLDVVGFRRLGHNEGDEPSYTQPLMYARVKAHEGVRAKYAAQLVREGVLDEEAVNQLIRQRVESYEATLARAKEIVAQKAPVKELPAPVQEEDGSAVIETAIEGEMVRAIAHKISVVPEGFNINPKMVGQLARRAKMGEGEAPMDWAFAEAIAYGSLVLEGTRVRLSGQDSGRGTFSQRHAVMYDTQTGQTWAPLSELRSQRDEQAVFEVFDSSLSEQGVLGFEYGYSVIARDALVLWEAQFGDFGNGAQVILDQYIAASEDKWQQKSRLALLLPHGYEGQGPEHSSARLERYLQLCAENNLQVCYPTTPAQYFHLLRRQVRQETLRPLVVMTPKSLLRLPAATSTVEELTSGGFQPVIDDAGVAARERVRRIILCSGKVYYDLNAGRRKSGDERVAILRLEQFYPFPEARLLEIFRSYQNATQLVWAQEEPKNMGGWTFVEPRLMNMLPGCARPFYVGRAASASPATGSYTIHELEQRRIVDHALTEEDAAFISGASTDENAAPASS